MGEKAAEILNVPLAKMGLHRSSRFLLLFSLLWMSLTAEDGRLQKLLCIYFFLLLFYPDVKMRLKSASAGIQRSLAIKFKLLS